MPAASPFLFQIELVDDAHFAAELVGPEGRQQGEAGERAARVEDQGAAAKRLGAEAIEGCMHLTRGDADFGCGIAVQRHRHPRDRFVLAGPGKTPGAGEEPRIYHGDSMHVTIAYCVR